MIFFKILSHLVTVWHPSTHENPGRYWIPEVYNEGVGIGFHKSTTKRRCGYRIPDTLGYNKDPKMPCAEGLKRRCTVLSRYAIGRSSKKSDKVKNWQNKNTGLFSCSKLMTKYQCKDVCIVLMCHEHSCLRDNFSYVFNGSRDLLVLRRSDQFDKEFNTF